MGQGFDSSFQRQLASQSWALYGMGMSVISLRTFARWRRVQGLSSLAPDDWLMITLVPAFYTMLVVCLNMIATGGGSNLFPPEQFSHFSEDDIQERIKGSKIVVVSEQAMLNVIWTLKACMLFMFARMTASTSYRKWITYLSMYVFVGWVAVEIAFFTACRPFQGYWGMPPPDPQCTTFEYYAYVQATFNLSSDAFMLLIPLPMLVSLSLPLKQKLVLALVFSMGVFVIVAAILTKIYNLSDIYSTEYMLWYTREASVAVYVANLPGIWPLLRDHIRFLRNHLSYPGTSAPLPQYGNASSVHRSRMSKMRGDTAVKEDGIELGKRSFSKSVTKSRRESSNLDSGEELSRGMGFGRYLGTAVGTRKGSLESDERVLNEGSGGCGGSGWGSSGWGKLNLEVHVDRTIEVRRSWDAGKEGGEKERFDWEIETGAPRVKIEGPEGEVGLR